MLSFFCFFGGGGGGQQPTVVTASHEPSGAGTQTIVFCDNSRTPTNMELHVDFFEREGLSVSLLVRGRDVTHHSIPRSQKSDTPSPPPARIAPDMSSFLQEIFDVIGCRSTSS